MAASPRYAKGLSISILTSELHRYDGAFSRRRILHYAFHLHITSRHEEITRLPFRSTADRQTRHSQAGQRTPSYFTIIVCI